MSILNFTVYNRSTKKTVLPWQITGVHPPSLTFLQMFDQLKPKLPSTVDLAEVYIGRAKDSLDMVDPLMVIVEVTALFGPFAKFAVTEREGEKELEGQSSSETGQVCLSMQ